MATHEPQEHEPRKAKVLIVDDHPIARLGLTQLINQEDDLEVCAQAENAQEALKAITCGEPDVAVVDISLPGRNGLELVRDLRARNNSLPILVLSIHDEALYAGRALRTGASGYIMKEEAAEEVVAAIRCVLAGEIYLSRSMASRMLQKALRGNGSVPNSPAEVLTDRELEVFELMGRGMRTRQIAEHLDLSVKTVESHQAHIKAKLNLPSATELLRHAVLWVQGTDVC